MTFSDGKGLSVGPGHPPGFAALSGALEGEFPTTRWVLDGTTAVNAGALIYLASVDGPPSSVATAAQFQTFIDRLTRFLRFAHISTAVNDDGNTILRATITLGE